MRSPDTRGHATRPALRLLVVLTCFIAVLLGMTAPAEAARRVGHPTRVSVSHVTTSSATLRWSAPRKARVFRVQYSTSRAMKHAHYKRFHARSGRITHLKSNHRYYFRVRVIGYSRRSAYSPKGASWAVTRQLTNKPPVPTPPVPTPPVTPNPTPTPPAPTPPAPTPTPTPPAPSPTPTPPPPPAPTPTPPPAPNPGGFDLRTTKPTSANVGAGIIRSAPTKLATSADGTLKNGVLTITHDLKDRVVNGIVKVAANNLTIENCDIRGDVNNKPTSGAPMMVNTDSGTGTIVRYNTIHSTFASPFMNGIGHRNVIAEYNDISRVTDGFSPAPGSGPKDVNMTIRGNYVHDLQFYGNDPTHGPTPTTTAGGVTITGPWAGKPWNHADIVQIEKDGTTGVDIYGNNFDATWADDSTSTLPLPNAVKELSVFMLNAGVNIHIEDNWLDGGEYAVNNGNSKVTGTFARNRFGRKMAQKGTGDTSYYALMVGSGGLTTYDGTPNQNVWEDSGTMVPRNKGR